MKSFVKSIQFILISLFIFTCKEDYLNVPPQGTLDGNSLANPSGIFASLVSTYSMLDGKNTPSQFGITGSNWVVGSVSTDDSYTGSELGDFPNADEIELYRWLPGNFAFEQKFLVLYEGIARANAALRLLYSINDLLESDRSSYEGELKFLRAHYHFEAHKMWGDIPYYLEEDVNFRKKKSEPFPFLESDLSAAIELLPVDQDAPGRVTKGVAQAFLGKLYLYYEEYEKAKILFDAVVNSNKYELQNCFHEIFSVPGENGSEMMLAFQASVNDGTAPGTNHNPDIINYPFGLDAPGGCCGFHQPSYNLVNAFKVDDQGLPMFDAFNNEDVKSTDNVDPRLDWTVGRDGVPYLNWGSHNPGWIRDRDWAGPYSPKKNVYHQGAGQGGPSNGWYNLFSSLNFHIMRYADVLLMLAECEVELGNLERARELVNIIRQRAGNCAQGAGIDIGSISTSLDDPSITWANYRVGLYTESWSDKEFARKAVRFERRLELAMEGHRLFDLRRWGIAQEVINNYLEVEKEKRNFLTASSGYEPKHNLYPLPENQVKLSEIDGEPQLGQNDGY